MIRSNLSVLMGKKRVKIIDVARATGISRNMISALYYEQAKRIDLDALDRLCQYFDCAVGDLFEYIPDNESSD